MAPLLTAGALERGNVPTDVPDFFVDQLFFPYAEGLRVRPGRREEGRLGRDRPALEQPARVDAPRSSTGAPYPPPAPEPPAGERRDASRRDSASSTPTRSASGRCASCSAARCPQEEAAAAASGWRGDRIAFFVLRAARPMSYVWRMRFDGPAAAARFEAALKKAREKRPVAAPETIQREGADVVVTAGLPEKVASVEVSVESRA